MFYTRRNAQNKIPLKFKKKSEIENKMSQYETKNAQQDEQTRKSFKNKNGLQNRQTREICPL